MEKGEWSSKYDPTNKYSNTGDNFLADGYVKDRDNMLVDSQEYVTKNSESLIKSLEKVYLSMSINYPKEPKVSKVVDYQEGMIDDPILK